MQIIVVRRDDERDLRFTGERIAHVSSSWDTASYDYSGSTGRRAKLTLYRTKSGRSVCELIEESQWEGEQTRYSGCVCDTQQEVFEFFGADRFAKELYCNAKLQYAEELE